MPESNQPNMPLYPWEGRAILLVDLDAFFASVEQRDHPEWRGKPVIVGGKADSRGVVSTASYEARAFGVHSAMPSSQAARLCPHAIWTPGDHHRYKEVSNQVMDILHNETPFVQQVSIDEAFLDVTPNAINREHPVAIAQRIQHAVEALGITCSIGVGTTKSIAKIASDMDKPRGLTVVFPGSERTFLDPLPVRAMSGVGKSAEEKLKCACIKTLGDVVEAGPDRLMQLLGKNGYTIWLRASGQEDTPVQEDDSVKSVSSEMSFATDITTTSEVHAALATMATKVGRRLRKKGLKGSTLTLKLRYHDRSLRTIQKALPQPSDDDLAFIPILKTMLQEIWREGVAVRLIGVGMSGFDEQPYQTSLFDLIEDTDTKVRSQSKSFEDAFDFDSHFRPVVSPDSDPKPLTIDKEKRRQLLTATDALKDRFGDSAIRFGHEVKSLQNTTGTSSKNVEDYNL